MRTMGRIVGPVWGLMLLVLAGLILFYGAAALMGIGSAVEDLAVQAKGKGKLVDVDNSKSHGAEKHGEVADVIAHRCENGGHFQTWYRKKDGHYIEVCTMETEEGNTDWESWGIRVVGEDAKTGFYEITAFPFEGNAHQMEWYLSGRGYANITPLSPP